jgi:hypothetical protein|nr:MAG TPA: hypothetical protein [Caudoviricetes sp.]
MKANVKHALRKLGYYQQEPLELFGVKTYPTLNKGYVTTNQRATFSASITCEDEPKLTIVKDQDGEIFDDVFELLAAYRLPRKQAEELKQVARVLYA